MPIVIDGHNLLHSIQKAGGGPEQISDVSLCRIINEYLKLTGERGEMVFDGTGPRDKSVFENISNLEVFFAGLGTDADTVIEGKIKANTAPRRLTVVSSDRRVQSAARARKAIVVKALVFWNDLCKRLSRREKTPKEPTAKREGLTESETEQWLKIFGLEK
ncbi:MAG: NYN domain-containing protein [Planctomycetota bacterium]|nr:MAG: NYN domain-containing protein [Planctomycetota bacterium]